jgi:hypothetical protein
MIQKKEIYIDFGDIVKHEARLKLWLPALRELRHQLRRPLKYFTLSGPHAYDVILWEQQNLLEYDGRGYPKVRFCEMDAHAYADAKRILGNTVGIQAQFEEIINSSPKTGEFKAFWDLFPYDVYNLDFCGTWFEKEEPVSDTFDAIINLINRHIGRRNSQQFLLFLTIRIDRNRMNREVISDLKENIRHNSNNTKFADIVSRVTQNDIDGFFMRNFDRFILISIPKLIGFKLLQSTRRRSANIIQLKRALYPRKGYKIGKFVFKIGKQPTNYMVCPPWYQKCVETSFKRSDVLHIYKRDIPESTKTDLQNLKSVISRREGS